jgi:hypothetical protein
MCTCQLEASNFILYHLLDVFEWHTASLMALEINMHAFLMNLSWHSWIYILCTHLEHTVFVKASKEIFKAS